LDKIREFRNRVYHNEPVCFNGNKIDFREAMKIKKEILEVLGWIDHDIAKYINQFDNVDAKIHLALSL